MKEIVVDNRYMKYGFHLIDDSVSVSISFDGEPQLGFIIPMDSCLDFVLAIKQCMDEYAGSVTHGA